MKDAEMSKQKDIKIITDLSKAALEKKITMKRNKIEDKELENQAYQFVFGQSAQKNPEAYEDSKSSFDDYKKEIENINKVQVSDDIQPLLGQKLTQKKNKYEIYDEKPAEKSSNYERLHTDEVLFGKDEIFNSMINSKNQSVK